MNVDDWLQLNLRSILYTSVIMFYYAVDNMLYATGPP